MAGTEPMPETLRLVTFAVAGCRFAADADQLAEVRAYDRDRDQDDLFWLQRTLFPTKVPAPVAGILAIKGLPVPVKVAIERLDALLEVGIDAIRPLPPLMAARVHRNGVWGVVPAGEVLLLLLDLHKLWEVSFAATVDRR